MIANPDREADAQVTTGKNVMAALEPIVALLLDGGINVHAVTHHIRWLAAHQCAERHRQLGKKPSVSRIAAATGLTRAEARQLLNSSAPFSGTTNIEPKNTDRVAAAWRNDPDYLEANGDPRPLSYNGPSPNFCDLVKKHGGDIPPRAMLKELLTSNRVYEPSSDLYLPKNDGQSQTSLESIQAFGSHLNALGTTLLENVRSSPLPNRFERLITISNLTSQGAVKIKREITRRSATFAQSIERFLLDEAADSADGNQTNQAFQTVGVIVAVVEKKEPPRVATEDLDNDND